MLRASVKDSIMPPYLDTGAKGAVHHRAGHAQHLRDRGNRPSVGVHLSRGGKLSLGELRTPSPGPARAAASPAFVRSRIKSRSNSASDPSTWNRIFPAVVVVSNPSVSDPGRRLRKHLDAARSGERIGLHRAVLVAGTHLGVTHQGHGSASISSFADTCSTPPARPPCPPAVPAGGRTPQLPGGDRGQQRP